MGSPPYRRSTTRAEMGRGGNAVTTKAARDEKPTRQPGLRGVPRGWIGLAVCIVMGSALILSIPATVSATRPLTVSLTFDDGSADQMTAHQLLKNHGMVGTFYINSSFIGPPGFMTRATSKRSRRTAMKSAGTRSTTRA